MVGEQKSQQDVYRQKVDKALKELNRWQEWQSLSLKLDQSRTSWLTASNLSEPFSAVYPCAAKPKQFSVIATDGSQIFPDRHELAFCYLINISSIVLHYGTGVKPLLASYPTLFYKEEDLYQEWNRRKVPVDGEIVGILRNLMEFQELARLARECVPVSPRLPLVALYDGTLIFWHLEATPEDFSAQILREFLKTLDYFQEQQIPIAGYISYPRSTDVINALRVGMCPENPVNCDRCPYRQHPELPCEPIEGVRDQLVYTHLLNPGERSTVFRSTSRILKNYGPHDIYFFYLHVGSEIARIEIPQWVAKNENLLRLTHATIYDQAEKGQGYPVSLTEAHEKAIVRGADRELFYRLLQDSFIQQSIQIRVSQKSQKKRNISI